METTTEMIPNFSSEEERNEFINGDRKKRILLDMTDTETALQKLDDLSKLINEKSEKITAFYFVLEEKLRKYEIGFPFILKEENDDVADGKYRLCYHEDLMGDLFFWRLGFSKLNGRWHIVAHFYKIDNVEGPEFKYVWLEDSTVKLTHAPRELRTAAAHVIRDFVQKFLGQVNYNEHVIDCALKRIEKLEDLVA